MHKISCSTWHYRKYEIEDLIPRIAGIGYSGIEIVAHHLGTDVGYHLFLDFSKERFQKIKDSLNSYGLKVVALSPSCDFLKPVYGGLKADIEHIKKMTDLAADFGASILRPFATNVKPKGWKREKALKIIIESLKECTEYARQYDIRVALENHGTFPNLFENIWAITEGVNSDYFGITYHNGRTDGETSIDAQFKKFVKKIYHVHLTDWKRKAPPVPELALYEIKQLWLKGFNEEEISAKLEISKPVVHETLLWHPLGVPAYLGEGDAGIENIIATLQNAGYSGWYNFEGSDIDEDPDESSKKAYEYLKKNIK